MKGQDLFEAMSYVRDDIVEESLDMYEDAAIVAPPVRESLLARFFQSNWGVAMICAVVSLSVLSGIIWAGHHDPFGHGHGGTEESETVTEPNSEDTTTTETNRLLNTIPNTDWYPDIPDEPVTYPSIEPGDYGTEPSVGLEYRLTGDYYTVVGMGSCTDVKLVIPSEYEGKPVKAIGDHAFCKYDQDKQQYIGNDNITSVVVSEGIEQIGQSAFYNCSSLQNIQLPTTLRSLGQGAFRDCTALVEVTVPQEVSEIPLYTFDGCTNLLAVHLSDGVKVIASYAFSYCERLHTVDMPAVEVIDGEAFQGSYSFVNIHIPATIRKINANSLRGLFDIQYNTQLNATPGHSNGDPRPEGWIHNLYYEGTLEQYLELVKNTNGYPMHMYAINFYIDGNLLEYLTIPEGVSVPRDAFRYCQSLRGVILPSTIADGSSANSFEPSGIFSDCPNLEWIVVQGSLPSDHVTEDVFNNTYYTWLENNFSISYKNSLYYFAQATVRTRHIYLTDTTEAAEVYINNYVYMCNEGDVLNVYPNIEVHYAGEWEWNQDGTPTVKS